MEYPAKIRIQIVKIAKVEKNKKKKLFITEFYLHKILQFVYIYKRYNSNIRKIILFCTKL